MRTIYLILAHKQPSQVARLVSRLTAPETSFFVHVDKRVDDAAYRAFVAALEGLADVTFAARQVCRWGEFGTVRAALQGLAEIVRRPHPFDYVVLLSGQDYPIKTNEEIHDFFQRCAGYSCVNYDRVPSAAWQQAEPRIKSWQVHVLGRPVMLGRTTLEGGRKWPVVVASHLLPRERRFPQGYRPFTGSAYWALSERAARLVDEVAGRDRRLVRFFEYTCCPDELFFQTVLLNSPLAGEMIDDDLHYIDWSAGGAHPATLLARDLPRLAGSPALFARKFDREVDESILGLIDRELLHLPETGERG